VYTARSNSTEYSLLANFEFYYHAHGVDVGFDPEFVSIFSDPGRLRAQRHQSARVLSRRLG
jgi:hypothetical protein